MNLFWDIYWPLFTAAVILGVVGGAIGFRAKETRQPKSREYRRHASLAVAASGAIVVGLGALWHGPLGAGERLASFSDRFSRQVLVDWEMPQVQAHLERSPLRRILVLSGPADDFQRSELVRIMHDVPGVASVRWNNTKPSLALPLLGEAELAGLVCFGLGLLLSYLLELRRRYRAQWRW
jgi:hypothetical protein